MKTITLEENFTSPLYVETTSTFAFGGLSNYQTEIARKQADFGEGRIADTNAAQIDLDELKRCVHELGFVGGIVNGTTDGSFLDDPPFLPVFQTASELDVPIYLHPAPAPPAVRTHTTEPAGRIWHDAFNGWLGLACRNRSARAATDRLGPF